MNRVFILCAIASLAVPSAFGSEIGSNGQVDIVVADEVRTAFYERAPPSLIAEISKATSFWCWTANRGTDGKKSNAETVGWLCERHKLRYFRNVYVTGARGPHGLVCEDNGTSRLKYFGVDLVEAILKSGSCVSAELEGTEYRLRFESLDASNDT